MNTVEVKTADLIGRALDWAVAKAVGIDVKANKIDDLWHLSAEVLVWDIPNYSTNWAQLGPLIERFELLLWPISSSDGRKWVADKFIGSGGPQFHHSLLIAACRAIVASEIGDTVMVPAELINGDEK